MRLRALALALTLLALPRMAPAQAAAGVLEVRSAPPGDRVTLEAPGLQRRVRADASGRAVFFHLPAGVYQVASEGQPARTVTLEPGARLSVDLRDGRIGAAPTTDAGRVFTPADWRRQPRPSGIWPLLADVPGVVLDRVDVGGSETALQSPLVSRGDTGSGATWTIDGADVSDPAALGSTLVFPDLQMLGAVRVRTSTLDARVRTPGVQVDLLPPAAADRFAGRAALRGSGGALQSDNLPAALSGRPFFRNRTERLLDAEAQAGGPLAQGRAWLFGAVSRSRLRQQTFTEHEEVLSVTTFAGRARARLLGTSLSLLALRNEKRHEDRDTGFTPSPEARWVQGGPTHLLALEGQRGAGSASLLARLSWLGGGFRLDPRGGRGPSAYEDFAGVFRGSYYTFSTRRPRLQAALEVAGAGRSLGFEHQWSVGAGYRRSRVATDLSWPGNKVIGLERQSVFFRTFQLSGFAQPTRDQSARSLQQQAEGFAQDAARRGRLTVQLGLRLDHLRGRSLASAVDANPEFPDLLPAVAYPGGAGRVRWTDLLPRAGASWDLGAGGRRVLHAGYAAYAAALSAGDLTFDDPIGREPATLSYYWSDLDHDHVVDRGELDLLRGQIGVSGLDPLQPGSIVSPNVVAGGLRAPRTQEARLALTDSLGPHLHLGLDATWRRTRDLRAVRLRTLTLADYVIRGAVTGTLFGEPFDVGFYAPASETRIVSGNGRELTNRAAYRQEALTLTLHAEARGGAWEARAWGAFTDWRERFADFTLAVQDPTPLDTDPLRDAGPLAVRPGGLGRADVFVNSRWSAGASAGVRLPAGLQAAAHLQAREGFPIPYFQVGNSGDPTTGGKNVLVTDGLDQYRLPALVLVDVRLERAFKAGPGTLGLAVDAFNVLNRSTALQVSRDVELPVFGRPREILRPRILRVGLEYTF